MYSVQLNQQIVRTYLTSGVTYLTLVRIGSELVAQETLQLLISIMYIHKNILSIGLNEFRDCIGLSVIDIISIKFNLM